MTKAIIFSLNQRPFCDFLGSLKSPRIVMVGDPIKRVVKVAAEIDGDDRTQDDGPFPFFFLLSFIMSDRCLSWFELLL